MRSLSTITEKLVWALCFCSRSAFTLTLPPRIFQGFHAPVPLFPAHPARDAERGGDRVAPIDVARRHDAAGGRRHLRLPAAGLSGAAEDLPDRARGAEPFGGH